MGALFPLLSSRAYRPSALVNYLLKACQQSTGGFADKPGKSRDAYHTCYSLGGLAATLPQLDDSLSSLLQMVSGRPYVS